MHVRPGAWQHRGATMAGSRNTGSESLCCLTDASQGCPGEPIFDKDLARERRREGWKV